MAYFEQSHRCTYNRSVLSSPLAFRAAMPPSWVPEEQNIGGNTQEELHSDVFVPNEHLLLSIIPRGTTDKLILALKKREFLLSGFFHSGKRKKKKKSALISGNTL